MARTFTRAEIRTRAEKYARLPACTTATMVTLVEADDWINVAIAELWELLMNAGLGYYAISQEPYTTTGSSGTLALPATFGRAVDFGHYDATVGLRPIPRITPEEAPYYSLTADKAEAWFFTGTNIEIVPVPAANHTYVLRYYAAPATIATGAGGDSTAIEGVSGWEDFIARRVAIDMIDKGQGDASVQIQMLERITARIEAERIHRKQSSPAGRIKDTDCSTRRRYPWV